MKAVQVLATLAFAATLAAAAPQSLSQCNTGNANCCNMVQNSTSTIIQELEGLLGIALGGVTGQVGLGCSPISVIGIGGGASCNSQAVCCTDAQFSGLINLGCSPLNL